MTKPKELEKEKIYWPAKSQRPISQILSKACTQGKLQSRVNKSRMNPAGKSTVYILKVNMRLISLCISESGILYCRWHSCQYLLEELFSSRITLKALTTSKTNNFFSFLLPPFSAVFLLCLYMLKARISLGLWMETSCILHFSLTKYSRCEEEQSQRKLLKGKASTNVQWWDPRRQTNSKNNTYTQIQCSLFLC